MAGKPRGPKSDKLWSDAVRMAVLREDEDSEGKIRKRLNIIADNLCKLAMAGDMTATKEIGDRLDGKPKQQTEVTGEDGGPIITQIERIIVKAANSDT